MDSGEHLRLLCAVLMVKKTGQLLGAKPKSSRGRKAGRKPCRTPVRVDVHHPAETQKPSSPSKVILS